MKRTCLVPALALVFAFAAMPLHAEVKKEERNQATFSGVLGRMFSLFGGRAAKEGVVSTVAVSGDRKMTTTGDNSGQIVDLREEKIYDLDLRRKTFKVTTFEELRRQMREAEQKARDSASKDPKEEQPQQQGKEMEIDFDIKNTGQTKTINGFDTRQVLATITVREKGKKVEDSGGLIMTVDTWLTRAVSLKEIADFERRYWEKLAGPISAVDMQQMATAMAMFPGLKDAFARLRRENFDGTAIATTTTVDSVKSPEQMKEQAAQSTETSSPTSVGGAVGGAIGGFMRRRVQQNQTNASTARTTVMTLNNEVLKIATNVTAADVAMPPGFKERN